MEWSISVISIASTHSSLRKIWIISDDSGSSDQPDWCNLITTLRFTYNIPDALFSATVTQSSPIGEIGASIFAATLLKIIHRDRLP